MRMSTSPPERDGIPFSCVLGAWREYESELVGYLRHRLGDPHRADDLLQDVFVKAMRQGQAFCRLESPRAWLFQVARNAMVDEHRTRHSGESLPNDLAALPQDDAEPIDALSACIERVLPELEEPDRDVLNQCDLLGRRQQDYADSSGLTLAAVKSRLLRARRRLRERLTASCQVRFDETGAICCHAPNESA
jgi:RNA polymerase sigma-70 factor (ECF subfamily)